MTNNDSAKTKDSLLENLVVNINPDKPRHGNRSNFFNRIKMLACTGLLALTTLGYGQKDSISSNSYTATFSKYLQDKPAILYLGNESFGIRPILQVEAFSLGVASPFNKVSNIPEEYRLVPIHPDDSWISESSNGPISDGVRGIYLLEACFLGSDITGGVALKLKDVELEAAASFKTGWNAFSMYAYKDIKERDYMKDPGSSERGYGTALTYYQVNVTRGKLDMNLSLSFPSSVLCKGWDEDNRIVIGALQRRYDINVETGWDRYDDLEHRKDFYLTSIVESGIYVGWLVRPPLNVSEPVSAKIVGGYTFHKVDDSKAKYPGVDVSGNGWFLNLSMALRL